MKKIYLDNNATTFLDPRVRKAMEEGFLCGNPSSVHSYGREARNRLTKARRQIAKVLGVLPRDLFFTSGGTEALSMVPYGLQGTGHLITSNLEHPVLYQAAHTLAKQGWEVTFLEGGLFGAPTPAQVAEAIRPDTKLIALMAVNNETGVKTDIEGIARVAERSHIPFLVDGVALMGKEPFAIPSGVTAMAFSGHKFHGPLGTGFLFLRPHLKLCSLFTGGAQEGGKRPGTENLPGILGLAKAVELAAEEFPSSALRNHLEREILALYPEATINGKGPRSSNTSNIAFGALSAEDLMMNLDLAGVAVSHGSACSSGSLQPSRVLLNMGYSHKRAAASLRFSISRMTTEEEVKRCLDILGCLSDRLDSNDLRAKKARL